MDSNSKTLHGACGLVKPTQRATSLGTHTAAPNRLPEPRATAAATSTASRGARPIGGAR